MKAPTSSSRRGFTFVELLVVIAIIGILVSLLLPVVSMLRDVGRRHSCANNLAQLAIALQGYETFHGVLPSGVVNAKGPIRNEAVGYHMGWLVQILPNLDEKNAFRMVNFSVGVYDRRNAAVRVHRIRTLLCPSDTAVASIGADAPAPSSYAGCHNDVEAPIDTSNDGVLFLNSRIGQQDILDGTSHTLVVGEKKLGDPVELGWMSGTRATMRNTGVTPNGLSQAGLLGWGQRGPDAEDGIAPADQPGPPSQAAPGESGKSKKAEERALLTVGMFSSYHPGGANFLMADGSVRLLSNAINPLVFAHLGNRADGYLTDEY